MELPFSSSGGQSVKDQLQCATQPHSGVAKRPHHTALAFAPCVSVTAINSGETMLIANVRTVQSSRCVCSGFISVSLRLSAACSPIEPSVMGENFPRNVLEAAADLLFLGVAHQMASTCMTVDALRTLRVYYQPDQTMAESSVQEALQHSCHRILHVAVPFILVPAIHILRDGDASLPICDTPLLCANFLFIDLLQVKSEIWIAGH